MSTAPVILSVKDMSIRFGGLTAVASMTFEVKEGEATIFKIDNGAYSLVARIQIDDWARIAAAVKPAM